jgi:hypothetical protein
MVIKNDILSGSVISSKSVFIADASEGDIILAKVEQFIGLVVGSYGETRGPGLLALLLVAGNGVKDPGTVAVHDGHGGLAYVERKHICYVCKPSDPFYGSARIIVK